MTGLDIIDTAVKIGLGAIITGIAGYFVSVRGHKFELHKIALEDQKGLYRDIAKNLEEGTKKINLCFHEFYTNGYTQREQLKPLLEGYSEINQTKSLAAISGSTLLFESVSSYATLVQNLYLYLIQTEANAVCGIKGNEMVKEINSQLLQIYKVLGEEYDRIWKS